MKYKNKYKKKSSFARDGGDENWLISYADLMTLLWGFFVILSAFSVPNANLLEKLKKTTAESMGGEYERPFSELTDELKLILKEVGLENVTKLENSSEGVKLSIRAQYFFNSGDARINDQAYLVLKKIGNVLRNSKENIMIFVEGHTDDVPIHNSYFPSNWELSASRASSVVRLFEEMGIRKEVLRPIGLSDTKQTESVANLSGEALNVARAKNRRIVIRVQKKLMERSSMVRDE